MISRRILIADDNALIRQKLRSLLQNENLEVCAEAADGREAIEKTRQCRPDLIILNLSMPEMSGWEALPGLLAVDPEVKILIFSVDDSDALRAEALRRGAKGFVNKSDTAEVLRAEIHRLLG